MRIMVQDLFANRDVLVNTTSMLSVRSQLEPNEFAKDRRVASKRIRIERIIGLAKIYKILKKEICQNKVQLSPRIIYLCFVLANFRNSIADKYAYGNANNSVSYNLHNLIIYPLFIQSRAALNKYNFCIPKPLFLIHLKRLGKNIIIIFKVTRNTNEFIHI